MTNPHEREIENMKARVRCGDCRTTFHERLNRIIHGDRVSCPTCGNEMHFRGIGQMRDHETLADFIHHVEERTSRPHFSLRD